jgi:hypothetical protein
LTLIIHFGSLTYIIEREFVRRNESERMVGMTTKIKMACGCKVSETPFNQLELIYCPLHESAQKLAQAVEHSNRVFSAWEEDANPHNDLKRGDSMELDAAKLMVKTTEDALRAADLY